MFCLGNCALGPSVAVDGRLHGGVDADGGRPSSTTPSPSIGHGADRRRRGPRRRRRFVTRRSTEATVTVYVPRDAAARSVGADEVAAAFDLATGRARRAQRLARHAVARAAGRGGDARGPRRLRTGARRTTSPASSRPACSTGGDHPLRLGADRRARRGCAASSGSRSRASASSTRARPTTTRRHGGLAGLRRALGDGTRPTSSPRSPTSACAAAAARRSRPASSGARCSTRRARRSTSSATPTRATAARSPTACSWRAIRSR